MKCLEMRAKIFENMRFSPITSILMKRFILVILKAKYENGNI